jgi:hypothetical protein
MCRQRATRSAAPRRSLPVGAALAALLIPACGSTDEELRRSLAAERGQVLHVVSRRDIKRQPAGSPGRAVMELWRAVQFDDAKTAVSLMAPRPTRAERPRVEELVVTFGGVATDSVEPRIVDVNQTGRRARVLVERRKQPTGRRMPPIQVELVRSGREWRVRADRAFRDLLREALR